MIEQDRFIYSSLGKVFEKQTKEQFEAIKDLNISDKANELKQIHKLVINFSIKFQSYIWII